MAYIGIDLGSSGVKAVALGEDGQVIATAKRSLSIHTAPGGVAEQSAQTWREKTGECLREIARQCKPAAVAATGQMDGPVLLDAQGQVIAPVQMWCDTRCAAQCEQINQRVAPRDMLAATGHAAVTGYTAPKLMWLAEHAPDVFRRAVHLLFPKDFLTYTLTGQIGTDYSDASNSLLLDIRRGAWSQAMVESLGLGSIGLPALADSGAVVGRISVEGARWSGLPEGLPVAAGAGDSIAAALGAGLRDPAVIQIVIGTAGNVNVVSDQAVIDPAGRVHTGYFADRSHWIISGVQQSAGSCLQWWSGITGRSEEQLVAELDDSGGQVAFAPYLSGERTPHLDPHVRAAFVGLDRGTTRADMTRGVLEGVALSFRDAVDVLGELGVPPQRALVCGGGANSEQWCGIIATGLGLPVARVTADTTARGAAMLAAVAAGRFSDWSQASLAWPVAEQPIAARRCATTHQRFQQLYPLLREIQP